MFRKNNSLFFTALSVLAVSVIYNICNTNDIFAYTASISTSGTVNLDVSASGNGANVAKDDVVVTSTCPLGYTLSIKGPADNTLYKDGDNANNANTQMILASSGTKTSPVSILGSNINTWGYNLGDDLTINSSFIGLTNTYTELANSNSASANGGDKYSVTYGASVDATIEPGTYKLSESTSGAGDNVITYFLTSNPACDTYAIRYNDNGANSPTKMGNQTVSSISTDLTLWASNFQRSGYGFAGWNTKADGTGTNYGPNQTIVAADMQAFVDDNTKIENGAQYIDLYAMWVASAGDLQSWNGCSAMAIGDVTALTDTRDNDTYAVAKLADGKCWMIENLRLGGATAIDDTTLNSTNTHNPSSGFILSASQDPTETAWCNMSSAGCLDQSLLFAGNTISPSPTMTTQDDTTSVYSQGNYYNWYSITAGSGTSSQNSGNATGDICPAGWHLPTGQGTSSEFGALDVAMGGTGANQDTTTASNRWRAYPNNFIFSGYVENTSVVWRRTFGEYWSSTALNSFNAYGVNYYVQSINPGSYNISKRRGVTARCVSSESYTIEFNSNGGSGTMTDQMTFVNQNTVLNTNTFTASASGYKFGGWNTVADGTGTSYSDGEEVINLAAGNGTVMLYAQWICGGPNTVCYDDNGANSTTKMGPQVISSGATEIDLWASNFQRPTYGFLGWSTEKLNPSATDFDAQLSAAVSSGKVYGPNQTIPAPASLSASELQLYAVWRARDRVITAGNTSTMWRCSSIQPGEIVALSDDRIILGVTPETYAVAKLADGNCWMIENFRLDNKTILKPDFTNNPNLPLTLSDGSTANHLSEPGTGWCGAGTAACIDKSTLNTNNTLGAVTVMSSTTQNIYSYGNYYNWYSATAGNGTYNMSSGNASGDICPAGFHLPTKADFDNLNTILGGGSNAWRSYPNNFLKDSRNTHTDHAAMYWTSSTRDNTKAYQFRVFANGNNPDFDYGIYPQENKFYGYSVRCMQNGN